jgi:hypothetical protein
MKHDLRTRNSSKYNDNVTFTLDSSCRDCMSALQRFKESLIRIEGAYGTHLKGGNDRALGITVRPDRNASGIVTHHHIELTED